MAGVGLCIKEIDLFERPVRLRLPVRCGVIAPRQCMQAFVRVRIELASGQSALGASAALMRPRRDNDQRVSGDERLDNGRLGDVQFGDLQLGDLQLGDLQLGNERYVRSLRCGLWQARDAYLADVSKPTSAYAFDYFCRNHQPLIDAGERLGLAPLMTNFAVSLIDRAVIDALCRARGLSLATAIRANALGVTTLPGHDRVARQFSQIGVVPFTGGLTPSPRITLRHTISLTDAIEPDDVAEPVNDGLPESLHAAIDAHGLRYFNITLSGDAGIDLARMVAIARCLDRLPQYQVTLDGNERFSEPAALTHYMAQMRAEPQLRRLCGAILWIAQPFSREQALSRPIDTKSIGTPLVFDPSNCKLDDFAHAIALGYRGVAVRSCGGVYRALLNATRCQRASSNHNPLLLTAEDCGAQPGLAVQQDLALAALLGIGHCERNGHQYIDDFASADCLEARDFVAAHPDLYGYVPDSDSGRARLKVAYGSLSLESLAGPGFASGALPRFDAMLAMPSTPVARERQLETG